MSNIPIIIKGYIIPKSEKGREIYAREISKEEMDQMYNDYRGFIKAFIKEYLNDKKFQKADDI